PHLVAACPEAVQAAVLELDPRTVLALGDEAHLDLGLQFRVRLPVGADVPGEDEARVGLPGEDAAPVTGASVVSALVPAAPDARLDPRVAGFGLAVLVGGGRPPGPLPPGEAPPRHLLRRPDPQDLPHAVRIDPGRYLLRHRFLSLVASRSAASLNATSAWL